MKKTAYLYKWPVSEKGARRHYIESHSAAADEMSPKDWGVTKWSAVHRQEHALHKKWKLVLDHEHTHDFAYLAPGDDVR